MSVDLSTRYLSLPLRNPLVVSAGPLTDRLDLLPTLESEGASAVVLPSMFEEQIEHHEWQAHRLDYFGAESFPEALNYFPDLEDRRARPDEYLRKIESARDALSIPVIASLNGTSKGGWIRYARLMESAGADAVELNIYFLASDPRQSSAEVEDRYVELVEAVRGEVKIPLSVKMGPYFSSMGHIARRLEAAGANGLVLFNRYLQPDINLETLEFVPQLTLSTPAESRLSLRWIAVLREHLQLSLAANSGIHSVDDVVKLLLAGADVTMLLAALLQNGANHLATLRTGLESWLVNHDYKSVEQMKGSMSRANCPNPDALERANYMRTLESYTGPHL